MELNPYLSFQGNCREAMNFYKSVLGGEFEGGLKTFADGGKHIQCNPEDKDKVMHVNLKTDDFSLMASDTMGDEFPFVKGTNITLSLNIEDSKAKSVYDKLSENGQVIMPFAEAFWGGKFGMLVDQFGIQWTVSTPHK
jgi:PhnB protein